MGKCWKIFIEQEVSIIKVEYLMEEYSTAIKQHRAVWQTFGSAFSIAISGIIIALVIALDKYDTSGPIFVIFPFVIISWCVMVELQGRELDARGKFLAILEESIRKETSLAFPCVESRIQPHLYGTWRYDVIWWIIGMPILSIYVLVSWKGLIFFRSTTLTKFDNYIGLSYVILPVIAFILVKRAAWLINNELCDIERRIIE